MAQTGVDRTGIVIPPPVFYAVPFTAGWLLHRSRELPLLGDGGAAFLIGAVLVIAGFAVAVAGVREFRRARTTVLPFGGTSRIVETGIYRRTRNPMYLGLALVYAGASFVLNSAWPLLLLPVGILLVQRFVIRYEERYLAGKFGAEYERYRRHVRRWL